MAAIELLVVTGEPAPQSKEGAPVHAKPRVYHRDENRSFSFSYFDF